MCWKKSIPGLIFPGLIFLALFHLGCQAETGRTYFKWKKNLTGDRVSFPSKVGVAL